MAEFGTAPEDKYKLSLLSIEKRFVELEIAIGEIQQKVQGIQVPNAGELEERVSDLEDVIYVEQAGIEELKGMLESQHEQKPEELAEEVQKIVNPSVAKIKTDLEGSIQQVKDLIAQIPQEKQMQEQLTGIGGRVNGLENRMKEMKNSILQAPQQTQTPEQMQEINAKIDQLEGQFKAIPHFRAELENLKNKVEPMNAETIKSVVGELSDLRIETSRELRQLKEKVGDAPLYADIQFLSNRIKDLKLTIDNLLNMKVEIDAKILNVERSLAERGGGGSSSLTANLISEVEDTKKLLFEMQKRISSMDAAMKGMAVRPMQGMDNEKQSLLVNEMESLYAKMNDLYAEAERKTLDFSRLSNVANNDKIAEMDSKISRLEEELHHVQSRPVESGSRAHEDQLKEILDQLILLQTRVHVLETVVMEPKMSHPIILE